MAVTYWSNHHLQRCRQELSAQGHSAAGGNVLAGWDRMIVVTVSPILTYLTSAVRMVYILQRSFNKVSTQLPDGRAVCTSSWKNVSRVPNCMMMAFSMGWFGRVAWEEASSERKGNWHIQTQLALFSSSSERDLETNKTSLTRKSVGKMSMYLIHHAEYINNHAVIRHTTFYFLHYFGNLAQTNRAQCICFYAVLQFRF